MENRFRAGAKVSLIILLLNIVFQLVAVYQTRHQLVSPLIPESTFRTISEPFILDALICAIAGLIGFVLYFFEKYLWIIILSSAVLIGGYLYQHSFT
jgi:hypothetical protein